MPNIRFGLSCSDILTDRDARQLRVCAAWATMAAFAVAVAIILRDPSLARLRALYPIAAFAGLAASVGTLRAYQILLANADELLRKIQVDALAFGFGAGTIFSLCYRLGSPYGFPRAGLTASFCVLIAGWAVGQLIGMLRYAPRMQDA